MSTLFDLLIRHRDSILYKLDLQEKVLEEAKEEVKRQTHNVAQSKKDLAEVTNALESLFVTEDA